MSTDALWTMRKQSRQRQACVRRIDDGRIELAIYETGPNSRSRLLWAMVSDDIVTVNEVAEDIRRRHHIGGWALDGPTFSLQPY